MEQFSSWFFGEKPTVAQRVRHEKRSVAQKQDTIIEECRKLREENELMLRKLSKAQKVINKLQNIIAEDDQRIADLELGLGDAIDALKAQRSKKRVWRRKAKVKPAAKEEPPTAPNTPQGGSQPEPKLEEISESESEKSAKSEE